MTREFLPDKKGQEVVREIVRRDSMLTDIPILECGHENGKNSDLMMIDGAPHVRCLLCTSGNEVKLAERTKIV